MDSTFEKPLAQLAAQGCCTDCADLPFEPKAALEALLPMLVILVRTARLELAQLSPLPPQDSVSTNFTTSAILNLPGWLEETFQFFAFQTDLEFTLKFWRFLLEAPALSPYFVGIWAAPEAGSAGGTGTAAGVEAGAALPGICAAPEAGIAGAVTATPSSTLELVRGCALPK